MDAIGAEDVWRDIPGLEGLYQASDQGQIRSLDSIRQTSSGQRHYKGRILKQTNQSCGYLKVAIKVKGVTKFPYVHRLVAAAFLGESELTVNHINEDKHDNRICNLEYMTRIENMMYGTGQDRSKAKQKRTPVESYDIKTGKTIETFCSQRDAKRCGYDQKSIWKCCNGQQKSHKGIGWRYIL